MGDKCKGGSVFDTIKEDITLLEKDINMLKQDALWTGVFVEGKVYHTGEMADVSGMIYRSLEDDNTDTPPASSWIKVLSRAVPVIYMDTGTENSVKLVRMDEDRDFAYYAGMMVSFVPKFLSTGPATLEIGELGAKPLLDGEGNALDAERLSSGKFIIAKYTGTDFRVVFQSMMFGTGHNDAARGDSHREKNALDYGEDLSGLNQAIQENNNIYIPEGEYTVNTPFDIVNGSRNIKGDNAVITISHPLEFKGAITDLTTLSQGATKGADKITLDSTSGISVGDVLIIHDHDKVWNGFRSYYNAGEYIEVRDISGNDIFINGSLYDNYDTGVAISKLANNSIKISGVKFVSDNLPHVVKISRMNGITIDGVKMVGNKGNATLLIINSYRTSIQNSQISTIGNNQNDYGIVFGNSQKIHILNTDAHGRRHGITTGGNGLLYNVPIRDFVWDGGRVSNDPTSGNAAYDYHGNIENARCVNATIVGGIFIGGKDVSYKNCTVSVKEGSAGWVFYAAELLGGTIEITDNLMLSEANPDNTGRGYIDFGGNSLPINEHTKHDVDIVIKNNILKVKNDISSSGQYIIPIRASGFTGKVDVDVDNNKILGFQGKTFNFLRLLAGEANGNAGKSNCIIADHIVTDADSCNTVIYSDGADGSTFRNAPLRLMRNSGVATIHTTTDVKTKGVVLSLKFKYPKIPGVLLGNNNMSYLQKKIGVNRFLDSLYVAVSTDDGTNFSTEVDIDVAYETVISEC